MRSGEQQRSNLLTELFEFKVSCFPSVDRSRRASLLIPRCFDSTELETHQIPLEQPPKAVHRHPSESAQISAKYRKLIHDNRVANKKRMMENGSLLATQVSIKETLRLMAQSAYPSGRTNSLFLERKIAKEGRLFALHIGESRSYVVNLREKKYQPCKAYHNLYTGLDVLTVTKLHGPDLRQKTRAKFFANSPHKPIIKFRPPRLAARIDTASPVSRSFTSKEGSPNQRPIPRQLYGSDLSTASMEPESTENSIRFCDAGLLPTFLRPDSLLEAKEGISGYAFTVLHLNGDNHTLITEHNQHEKLEFASLTKIMTCLLVLLIGERMKLDLKKLQTKVSHRAASLQGTTAKLESCDSITIFDLLHGMMLPSGNDAAMALAEWGGKAIRHYCRRRSDSLSPRKAKTAKIGELTRRSPVSLFIYHMNCVAKNLGMCSTRFANCHGLMNRRNLSCSDDLTRLCVFVMQRADFTAIVRNRSYTCIVHNTKYLTQRTLTWNNTNKLLKLEGTIGVKTGITPSAGSCLASCFYLSPTERIYVVLLKTLTVQHRFEESKQLLVEALRWLYRTTASRKYLERVQSITKENLYQLPGESNEDSNNFYPPSEEDYDAFEDESQICDINIEL